MIYICLLYTSVAEALKGMAGVMIGPGFGQRGIDGKFVALKYTRTNDIPTFGICLGMQCIAIEFARNVLGYEMCIRDRHTIKQYKDYFLTIMQSRLRQEKPDSHCNTDCFYQCTSGLSLIHI